MDTEFQYGELIKDQDFVKNCENFKENLKEVQEVLSQLLPLKQQYDKLTIPQQIELDLFLAYTLNSMYWVHLRIQGVDPTTHPIKDELQRIKGVLMKWQEIQDREKRPTVDLAAVKRFIRSGLYDPCKESAKPPNKKMKFEDNEE